MNGMLLTFLSIHRKSSIFYSRLTGHWWRSPVNKTALHICHWAGLSVCSLGPHQPLQLCGHSYRNPLSKSSRGERSETSEPPGGSGKMADRGGNRMTEAGHAALEERMTRLVLLVWRTSLGWPTSIRGLDPRGTTDSRQCGAQRELLHLCRSSLCSSACASSLCLLSWLTC